MSRSVGQLSPSSEVTSNSQPIRRFIRRKWLYNGRHKFPDRDGFDLSSLNANDWFTGCTRCFWQENEKVAMVGQCPDCGGFDIHYIRVEPKDKGLPDPHQRASSYTLEGGVMRSNFICIYDRNLL